MNSGTTYTSLILFFLAFLTVGCEEKENSEAYNLPSKKYVYVEPKMVSALPIHEKVYVPIYSEIYHKSGERRFPLTATVSIRNTHEEEHIYIDRADYYGSNGELIRNYLKKPIDMGPLESVEFVVEDREHVGGAGANFIIEWGADNAELKPIFQAVMIGTGSNQGISFVTEGHVVKSTKDKLVTE